MVDVPSWHIMPMRLNEWMNAGSVTDEALAARLEVDRSTISRIRRGTRMPSTEMMRKIREATGGSVTANDFVHEVDELDLAKTNEQHSLLPRPIDTAETDKCLYPIRVSGTT
jgi:transcriptional regulator with XRE-family HTH domain